MKKIKATKRSLQRAWRYLSVMLLTVVVSVTTTSQAHAATPTVMPAVACLPSNNSLAGPLKPVFRAFGGALGGLIPGVGAVMFICAAVMAILLVLTKKASGWISKGALVLGLVLALPFIVVLYEGLQVMTSNMCGHSLL